MMLFAEDLVLGDLNRCLENLAVNSPEQDPRSFSEGCSSSSSKLCIDRTCPRLCQRRSQESTEELPVDTRSRIIETIEFYAGPLFIFQG